MEFKTLNLLVSHQRPDEIAILLNWWSRVSKIENILVAYGGARHHYDNLGNCPRVYVTDEKLGTKDHQREKQSYSSIFRGAAEYVRGGPFTHVYLCEYDQIPLVSDLNQRQVELLWREDADVMGHSVIRVDGSGMPHYLYHRSDPGFENYWNSISVRNDKNVVLSMLGTGTLWTREAFLAVARLGHPIDAYVELYLPTVAHHLGFRVRPWGRQDRYVSAQWRPELTLENASRDGAWTVHPVKSAEALVAGASTFGKLT